MKPTIPPTTLYTCVKDRKSFFLAFFLILISITSSYAQPTFFGVSSTPTDNAAQAGPTVAVTPPASMLAGDLAIIYAHYRGTGVTLAMSAAGGQTWNAGATTFASNQSYFISWCRYNGTWGANPSVTAGVGNTNGLTVVMYVYRPTTANSLWGVNIAQTASGTNNANPSPITAVTTTLPNTVTMAFWCNALTDTWGTLTGGGTGWSKTGLSDQYRNTTTGQSHTAAYNIRASAGSTGATGQTMSTATNTLRTKMTWYELNDNCSGAINLTAGAGCTNTPGTLVGATISGGVPAGCATGNLYDVWYSFTATSSTHRIALSSYGTNFTRRQIEVYKGTCGGLSLVTCSPLQTSGTSLNLDFADYSLGTTYYIRVIYPNTVATPISTNGTFNICVSTTTLAAARIQTGKSYTNITRPNGGVVQIGDVLEFRNVIAVGDWSASGSIYNTTFHDTIPAGLSYVANSISFATNEGLLYESGITGLVNLTDASGDDEAVYNGGVIRVNVGSLNRDGGVAVANRQFIYECSPAVTPITYASAGGGKITPRGRPSQFGSFSLIVVQYQVTVTAATGTAFSTSNAAFRYKITTNSTDDIGFPQTIVTFPRYSVYVSDENTLCQTSVGINAYSNGDFGSGTTRHDSTQLALAPGYTWSPFETGNPGDGLFSVVNNTSADLSTNKYAALPDAVSRVFSVWDIIGDHTNSSPVDSGNNAVAYGANGGYMAVVNAAYGINTAVQRNITGLCSDTYYEFSAWFKNICAACSSDSTGRTATGSPLFKSYLATKTLNDSSGVSPDVTFTIDGVDYYTSGSVTYDRRWVKKGFLFKTGPAQTSVTLTIRNNAPGGGGNDWAFDDVGLATCLPSLTMRPSNTPTYCTNGQVDMSVIVNTFYNNYGLYQWERSTDGGGSWHAAPELPGVQSYTYTFNGTSYLDTVAYPPIIATAITNGYKYRIKTATSLTNLSSSSCSVYNTVDVITITVDGGCVVLPVELLQFNAQLKNGYTELKWQSKQEQDLQRYEVERSADGKNFVKIGAVTAKGGNDAQNYTFTDSNPVTGKVYYRLQLVSAQSKKYSNILSVTGELSNKFELTNLVNPFNAKISFQVTVPQSEVIEVNLLDAAGKLIYQTKMNVNKGINAMNFAAPSNIQKGNYLLRVVSKEGVVNKVIQKH